MNKQQKNINSIIFLNKIENSSINFVCLFILTLILSSYNSFSKQNDTLRYKTLLVEVSNKRIISDISLKYYPNSILSNQDIIKHNALQLNEVLQFTPGMYIKDYGGFSGIGGIF